MSTAVTATAPGFSSRTRAVVFGACITAAVFLTFGNELSAPWVYDDQFALVENPAIRTLWFGVPESFGIPTMGRPVARFTFALNYAFNELDARAYRAVNILIHAAAACALFGLTCVTLRRRNEAARDSGRITMVAAAVAGIWAVHPLHTETITYVSQRTELLMGLFYLLTLYFAARAWDESSRSWCSAAAILCCAIGMGCKEVMASAPLMVVLYDRYLLNVPWEELIRRRRNLYLGLAACWLLLAALVLSHPAPPDDNRGSWTRLQYLQTQAWAIPHYLLLALRPIGLCTDYGELKITDPAEYVPGGLITLGLLAATAWCWYRHRGAAAFCGMWFFLILAPTSSFVILGGEPVAERRMYLPLVAVIAPLVLIADRLVQRGRTKDNAASAAPRNGFFAAAAWGVTVVLAVMSHVRNRVYETELSFWSDAVAKRPDSSRGHLVLGTTYFKEGRLAEAEAELVRATQAPRPVWKLIRLNLGAVLHKLGRHDEAMEQFSAELSRHPDNRLVQLAMANLLQDMGRLTEAATMCDELLATEPNHAQAHLVRALIDEKQGNRASAENRCRLALELNPSLAGEAAVVRRAIHGTASLDELQRAHEAAPDDRTLLRDLVRALEGTGRQAEAERHLRRAMERRSDDGELHNQFGVFLAKQGKNSDALAELQRAVALQPDSADAHNNLGLLQARLGNREAARRSYEQSLQINPNNPAPHSGLGNLAVNERRYHDAVTHYRRALEINPNFADARRNLDIVERRIAAGER